MYPKIFSFIDSYVLFVVLGVLAAFGLCAFYFKYKKFTKRDVLDLLICASFAVAFGVIFAILFEALYELKWNWGLTFYGGLFGGVFGFLFIYFLFIKKNSTLKIDECVKIAPPAITLAHAFGRIGCFLEGCCYGKETDSWIGVKFPHLPNKVIPTQLIESIFLFILTIILLFLVFKKDFKYTFIIYLCAYSIFRFIIEFYRGDPRGSFLGDLSPSQVWCIAIWIIMVPLYFFLRKKVFINEQQ